MKCNDDSHMSYIASQSGGSDCEAMKKRERIRNSSDEPIRGNRIFYISHNGNDNDDGLSEKNAWNSFEAIYEHYDELEYGDVILFQRGGVYRQKERLNVKSGLSFGAYGVGEKPKIYGSAQDYAVSDIWETTDIQNIWYTEIGSLDAGSIIFDYEKAVGVKKFNIDELKHNGDFFHAIQDGKLYLYSSDGNPGLVYKNIEIAVYGNMFFIDLNATDIVFDNLSIKYGGSHGIGSKGNVKNIFIKNCEFSFIGGSLQNYLKLPKLRYGNAIQFWSSVENCVVENNWIYQVYDAGLTFQGGCDENDNPSTYKNISFSHNLIEYCTYSIEFFDRVKSSRLEEIYFCNNIMRFAGYGWGNQRPDPGATSHLTGWSCSYDNIINFSIDSNIFDCSSYCLVCWNWQSGSQYSSLHISNNTFYQKINKLGNAMSFGQFKLITASNQDELDKAINVFDSTTKLVKWIC